jgi:repressor LexA
MNKVKLVLKSKGVSQVFLAEKLGVSYNTVSSYSNNKRQPSLDTFFKIAEILDVKVKDLIQEK